MENHGEDMGGGVVHSVSNECASPLPKRPRLTLVPNPTRALPPSLLAPPVAIRFTSRFGQGTPRDSERLIHRHPRTGDVVYRERDALTGREVAIKRVKYAANEAQILRSLPLHAHIVRVVDVLNYNARTYIVQELCSGMDLYQHMEAHGPLTEPEVKHVTRHMLSALRHCHMNGVAHGDVKPENMMLCNGGECRLAEQTVKLIDFGSARQAGKPTRVALCARDSCSTPMYTSPEVLSGCGASPACDVWSLGVTLCVLLAGGRVDAHMPTRSMSEAALEGAGASPPLAEMVRAMLRHSPEKRITTEQALAHACLV